VKIDPQFAGRARKLFRKHPDKQARVTKALQQPAVDPRYPALATKKYDEALNIWQSYVENATPGAWRVWWQWHPTEPDTIVVIAFGPHP
jgi:hypothetical protein